ncbi:zinc finger, CCHC-type containing protein [Tanacetum coccineum]|uniref:Zinc finger, CCHC-type containing protein n=1 Tax=Tanacetum coccineum TaxID=301880 RepID=A0ABQ4YET9_9ASTR
MEEEKSVENNEAIDKSIMEPCNSDEEPPIKVDKTSEIERRGDDEPVKRIAKDVLVEVVVYVYLMDFVILHIKEDEKRPFILGTPFLTTTKAVIKFDKGTITLRSRKNKASFRMGGKIKLHQEKEIEFDQWRSKNFNNGFPTPKKGNVDLKTKEESRKDV